MRSSRTSRGLRAGEQACRERPARRRRAATSSTASWAAYTAPTRTNGGGDQRREPRRRGSRRGATTATARDAQPGVVDAPVASRERAAPRGRGGRRPPPPRSLDACAPCVARKSSPLPTPPRASRRPPNGRRRSQARSSAHAKHVALEQPESVREPCDLAGAAPGPNAARIHLDDDEVEAARRRSSSIVTNGDRRAASAPRRARSGRGSEPGWADVAPREGRLDARSRGASRSGGTAAPPMPGAASGGSRRSRRDRRGHGAQGSGGERRGGPHVLVERAARLAAEVDEAVDQDDDVRVPLGMPLVDDEGLTPRRRAPVDRATRSPADEVAEVGVLDPVAGMAGDLVAANAWVSGRTPGAGRARAADTPSASSRSSRRCSHVTMRKTSVRTELQAADVEAPQREQRSVSGTARSSPAPSRSPNAGAPSTTSTPSGRSRTTSSRPIAEPDASVSTASRSSFSSVREVLTDSVASTSGVGHEPRPRDEKQHERCRDDRELGARRASAPTSGTAASSA